MAHDGGFSVSLLTYILPEAMHKLKLIGLPQAPGLYS